MKKLLFFDVFNFYSEKYVKFHYIRGKQRIFWIRITMEFNPQEPFQLPDLPPKADFESKEILKALITASKEVGELNGLSLTRDNPWILMTLINTQESVDSSFIENIVTTAESVLEGQVLPASQIKGVDKEVLRYREAMLWGRNNLENYSLSTRLILGIHDKLVPNSRGYRKQQNAIMNPATRERIYTPPIAANLDRHLQNWENFVNASPPKALHPLIRCAVAHYQFEAIHPFIDGNGRTGRILLVLQMIQEGLLFFPVLFVSGYLKQNQSEYYKTLLNVSKHQEWEPYVLFMLRGFQTQADRAMDKLADFRNAHDDLKETLRKNHPKMQAEEVTNHLFSYPVTTPTVFARALGVHFQTASKYLKELRDAGILFDEKVGRRHHYYCSELFKLLD